MSHSHIASPDNLSFSRGKNAVFLIFGLILIVVGLLLAVPGAQLIGVGGSWYYLLAGLGVAATGVLIALKKQAGVWLYALVFLATVVWALWEVGFAFWPLIPRLAAPAVLALILFLLVYLYPAPQRVGWRSSAALGGVVVIVLGLIGMVVGLFTPHGVIENGQAVSVREMPTTPAKDSGMVAAEWRANGRTSAGTRFAPFTQITPENVGRLKEAWRFQTGDVAINGADDQVTPIQVGDTLYICTPHNIVYALDAETGQQRWKFDPKAGAPIWQRCRGVSYYDGGASSSDKSASAAPATEACATRIITNTISAELYALDAKTGLPCQDFGKKGMVDLKTDLGEVLPGYYIPTSAPTVAGDLIITGAFVLDNASTDEPSGVVRAFNAKTGELAWAWDLGDPSITQKPPAGKTYTRSTPNVWSTPAVDTELGLVYLPMGNGTPDMYAAGRTKEVEAHSSSIVALDLKTGRERWKFQTVHHDMWDYDIPSQPALYNVPDDNGKPTPALIALTKRGQIFMLDRRTGTPIAKVEEKPVPQGAVKGDWVSPTQPYSTGMPAVGAEPLSEAKMWGATPLDQLYCRLWFKQSRYEGDFTPYSEKGTILYPSLIGGFNWGSASIDEGRSLLLLNDIRIPVWVKLIPHEELKKYEDDPKKLKKLTQFGFAVTLNGTPYAGLRNMMMTPLGIPCNEPPFGTFTAIDLITRKIVWQKPAGTVMDSGPMGIKMGLPIPIGMPTLGGSTSTATGVMFYAGTMDFYLRALSTATGKELWKGRLPVGSQGTPMTYMSPKSGNQFVVVSASGNRASETTDKGDYIIGFKLDGGVK